MSTRFRIAFVIYLLDILQLFIRGLCSVFFPKYILTVVERYGFNIISSQSMRLIGLTMIMAAASLGVIFWFPFYKDRKNYSRYALTFIPILAAITGFCIMIIGDVKIISMLPGMIIVQLALLSPFALSHGQMKE